MYDMKFRNDEVYLHKHTCWQQDTGPAIVQIQKLYLHGFNITFFIYKVLNTQLLHVYNKIILSIIIFITYYII